MATTPLRWVSTLFPAVQEKYIANFGWRYLEADLGRNRLYISKEEERENE
jgi:hypothetical protein